MERNVHKIHIPGYNINYKKRFKDCYNTSPQPSPEEREMKIAAGKDSICHFDILKKSSYLRFQDNF